MVDMFIAQEEATAITYALNATLAQGGDIAKLASVAKAKVELELAKLMMQKAATLYDSGDDMGAGESANMAKYAAAEASIACVDQAVQTLGGNGLAHEYGIGSLLIGARVARIAPVSREMILNFIAQFSLGLPKSY